MEIKRPSFNGKSDGLGFFPQKQRKTWLWIVLANAALIVVMGAIISGVFRTGLREDRLEARGVMADESVSHLQARSTARKGSAKGAILPTGWDAWGNPLYPTSSSGANIAPPSKVASSSLSCGTDSFKGDGKLTVRSDRPVLIAPAYKWACLPKLIAADGYMASWHATIMKNATAFYNQKPVRYVTDGGLGGSGVLDPAREVQLRIYHWGYAWRLTKDKKWATRAYEELVVASGNSKTQSFGAKGDNWNTRHFLDVGEFTAAFAYGYDWFYDAWTSAQKKLIRNAIANLGLKYGLNAYADPNGAGAAYSWWTQVNGNWNCVCNSGLTLGALAILNDDTTGIAKKVLAYTVPNAAANCAQAPSADGTWSETANYWYFGTYAHVRMAAALISATGSSHNLLNSNTGMKLSGTYHMYVTGMQGLFTYGDTGPNKYTATANGMMFYGTQYDRPMYTLFQRDRADAAEPFSMLYYDPQVTGQFWDGLPLDHYFPQKTNGWVSMRSSWTNTGGTYVAMKAGALLGHQAHGDLDVGDFVLDALGQRWAGEYGSGNYLATDYFASESQPSGRWLYFRKRTEGQNTLLLNKKNQKVATVPTTAFDSTKDAQTSLDYTPGKYSTAYFIADMHTAYGTAAKRAIRMLNGRKQVLLQDEITVPKGQTVQWRMQTNATISIAGNGRSATLKLGGRKMVVNIYSPANAKFGKVAPVRLSSDPKLPPGKASEDQSNAPASVLIIELGAGAQNIQVLFNPQWPGLAPSKYVSPPFVNIAKWSLTSHN